MATEVSRAYCIEATSVGIEGLLMNWKDMYSNDE